MAEVIDIKNGELLAIYSRLPLIDQPKESRIFFILGNEWSFTITFDGFEYNYEAYLQLKNKKAEFRPFEIDCEVGFKYEESSLYWETKTITNERDRNVIWIFNENDLEIPPDYDQGNILLFQIRFHYQIEPILENTSKLQDKAVQTSPYMDSSSLLECTSKDLYKLFENGFGHDVQLICGEEILRVHKVILCCRSSVFASKFENEDVDTYEVKIENMDATIFKQFIRYLYTGILPELSAENAIRLYEAAFEYSVDALGKLCASFLTENLSPDNAVEILKIADRYKDWEFKEHVVEYMTKEEKSLKNDKWKHFSDENPVLALEVLNFYVQQPQRKKPRLF